MAKFGFGTLCVFALSAVWLMFAWSNGNRTQSWDPTTAKVISNDVQKRRIVDNRGIGRNAGTGWLTEISYIVDGVEYEAIVDEYLIGNEVTVFVNPSDPTEVVGKAGVRIQDMFWPLLVMIASGLFAVVLLLIAFSPKED